MFKIIAEFIDPQRAYSALERLQLEGIDASILHDYQVWAYWVHVATLGRLKLVVPVEKITQARSVLDQYYRDDFIGLPEYMKETKCPKCGQLSVTSEYTLKQLLMMVFSFGIYGLLFPLKREQRYCNDCDHCWRETDDMGLAE